MQSSADPGIVTVALDPTPDNLDPRVGQNAASQRLAGLIFNSLVRKNENSEVCRIWRQAGKCRIPPRTCFISMTMCDFMMEGRLPLRTSSSHLRVC
jgi:hypothetical protein